VENCCLEETESMLILAISYISRWNILLPISNTKQFSPCAFEGRLRHKIICIWLLALCWCKTLSAKERDYRISWPIRRTVIFSLESLGKKSNDECIFFIVIYWKKIGLSHTKISNHNIIYSSQKPRKSLLLPLKSNSWLFSLSHDKDVV